MNLYYIENLFNTSKVCSIENHQLCKLKNVKLFANGAQRDSNENSCYHHT